VAAKVVHDDDVAGREGGQQELLDIGREALAVDGAIEDERRVDPVAAQGGEEGERAPVTMRHLVDKGLPAWTPATQPRHVGLGPGFVDEDEPCGVDAALTLAPLRPSARNGRSILFARDQRLF
jgi:hypothetical protein